MHPHKSTQLTTMYAPHTTLSPLSVQLHASSYIHNDIYMHSSIRDNTSAQKCPRRSQPLQSETSLKFHPCGTVLTSMHRICIPLLTYISLPQSHLVLHLAYLVSSLVQCPRGLSGTLRHLWTGMGWSVATSSAVHLWREARLSAIASPRAT